MQAMNGSGALGIRRLVRLLGCVAALVALSAMAVPSIAAARKARRVKETYLALGDSLAFGYSQQLFNENEKTGESPTAFEHGYANDYLNLVNGKGQIQLVNDGCPGETSASLIGNGPLLTAIQASNPAVSGEAPCAYHYTDGLPLHNEYGAGKSQLESAVETVESEAVAGKPVKAITLDIGANDQLHLVAKIEAEVKERQTKKVIGIATVEAEQAVAKHVETIALKEIEEFVIGKAEEQAYGETGGPGVVGLEAFEEAVGKDAAEYQAKHAAELAGMLIPDEETYAATHGAELAAEGKADGEYFAYVYETTHAAELTQEGNEVAKAEIEADAPGLFRQIVINAGATIATLKQAGFKGKLMFVGTYNTYGNDYGTGELLPGSNALLAALSAAEKAAFKKGPAKACFVDEQTLFNTESQPSEAEHMSGAGNFTNSWTNMGNFTEFDGKKNGPDIHATPLGYEKMAEYIHSNCKF
jgi:lysophospholipase L1-like esterase